MPSLPRVAAAVTGATVAAALAFPPSRRQLVRTATTALDELSLRLEHQWSAHMLLLTTEGRRSALPRTTVLVGVEHEGELYAVPWTPGAGWVANCGAHPDVVVDDRSRVRRARAAVVRGQEAAAVRRAYLDRHVPGWLRPAIQRLAGNAELPVVKLAFA
jgi:deazaflavin-dependent oxidoreductase (nitroreductase family)